MGGIYIIEFDVYPGIYKIGKSKDINYRFKQFQQNTAILGNVTLKYSREFEDYDKAEKDIHELLKEYRVQDNREFFKGDLNVFIKIIAKLPEENYRIITDKNANKNNSIYNGTPLSILFGLLNNQFEITDEISKLTDCTQDIIEKNNITFKILEENQTVLKQLIELYKKQSKKISVLETRINDLEEYQIILQEMQ